MLFNFVLFIYMSKNKLPITRINKFFSEKDFDFNLQLSQEYVHGDLNMKVILYRVDRQKTEIDDVYSEVGMDEIKFLPPVELNVIARIEEAKNNAYNSGYVRYNEPGNLTFNVFIHHLKDLGVDIRFGDYIGYQESESKIRYYTVSNDGNVVTDNKHNMFGYKPYYRTITCTPSQEKEFRGI